VSAFELDIRADFKRTRKALRFLEREAVDKAAARSINRAANKVAGTARREIAKKIGLPQKVFKRQVFIAIKANRFRLIGMVRATGKHLNLIEFVTPARKAAGSFRKKSGVVAKAYRQRKTYKGTFIGRGKKSGKLLVFIREGEGRLPVRGVYGPSVPKTFIQKEIERAMRRDAGITFNKEFERNIRFYIARM